MYSEISIHEKLIEYLFFINKSMVNERTAIGYFADLL